jgi:hypothetical protein
MIILILIIAEYTGIDDDDEDNQEEIHVNKVLDRGNLRQLTHVETWRTAPEAMAVIVPLDGEVWRLHSSIVSRPAITFLFTSSSTSFSVVPSRAPMRFSFETGIVVSPVWCLVFGDQLMTTPKGPYHQSTRSDT